MTIVASNSLTISNVNDGTITHTAYSYSADGTDRFTTVYPNLNLLVNTSAKTKDGFFKNFDKVENDYGEVTIKGTNTWVSKNLWDGFSIQPRDYKPNDKYTMSMDVMFTSWNLPAGTTLTEFWIGQRYSSGGGISSYKQICAIDLPRDPSNMLNQWIRITKTSTIPPYVDPAVNTEALFMTKFTGPSEGSYTIRIRKPKQEPGSIATPHMPSSSEVTTADYPSYIGQYSDFTATASADPAKYTPWTVFKGNDGVGIKTTVITYAISISGTIAPTTGWTSSVPSLVKGLYLWTKTVWTYTDNSSETGYSVTYISKDGNNGNDGIAGKDGTGIKTTTITYAGSTSGTTAPTSGWASTVPTVAAGSYLWTKTVWAYTDSTSETGYSVAKMGNDGATGPQGPQGLKGDPGATGIPGQAGADGKTSYLHIAYATNSTGTDGFDVSNATGKTYIGQYTDFTSTDSTDPSKYTWSLIKGDKGDKGDQGLQGPAGSNGDPGKVVSDTEPATRFKGLTWKYSGTADLTASDGTVILSGTEYYWSGTNWILSEINAHNINGNNLTITDGEFSSTIINGSVQIQTEIKDDHLLIYKMDTSHNEIHTIALKSDSGLAMTYQNSDTGEYTSAGVNFQGLFMQNNITNEFARLTPRGTDLSTDVPWTNLTLASGFSIGSGGKARYRVKNGVLYIHFRKIVCPALSGNKPNTLCYVPANGRASDGYDSFGVMSATNSTRIQYNDSGDGKVAIVPASNTTAGQGFNGFLICPID